MIYRYGRLLIDQMASLGRQSTEATTQKIKEQALNSFNSSIHSRVVAIVTGGTVPRSMALQDSSLTSASKCCSRDNQVKSLLSSPSPFCARGGIFHFFALLEHVLVGVDSVFSDRYGVDSSSSCCCNKSSMRHKPGESRARLLQPKPSPSPKGRSRCVMPMIHHYASHSSPETSVSRKDERRCAVAVAASLKTFLSHEPSPKLQQKQVKIVLHSSPHLDLRALNASLLCLPELPLPSHFLCIECWYICIGILVSSASWPGAAVVTHDAVRTHLLQATLQSETMLQRARRLLVQTILHNNIIRSYRWVATTSLVADISSTLDLAQLSRDPLKC